MMLLRSAGHRVTRTRLAAGASGYSALTVPSVAFANRAFGTGTPAPMATIEPRAPVGTFKRTQRPAIDSSDMARAIAERMRHSFEERRKCFSVPFHEV